MNAYRPGDHVQFKTMKGKPWTVVRVAWDGTMELERDGVEAKGVKRSDVRRVVEDGEMRLEI